MLTVTPRIAFNGMGDIVIHVGRMKGCFCLFCFLFVYTSNKLDHSLCIHQTNWIIVCVSWWSLGLEDDIICASYLWVREWLCRPILDLQSRAHSGHWKFAFVAGIQAAKWRRSLADCA